MIVWLASYPRSGNTLLRIILKSKFNLDTYSLYNDLLDINADEQTAKVVGHKLLPDGWTIEEAQKDDNLWLVKTHDYPLDDSKTIYILRDGRDVAVSFWNYLNNYSHYEYKFDSVAAGFCPFGSWSAHLKAWNPLHRKNTLLIKFEDLIENTEKKVDQIGDFLNVSPMQHSIPTFENLHDINPNFFFSGTTEAWKSIMTPEIEAGYWMLHGDMLETFGYQPSNTMGDAKLLIKLIEVAGQEREEHRKLEIQRSQQFGQEKSNEIVNLRSVITNQRENLEAKNKQVKDLKSTLENKIKKITDLQSLIEEQKKEILEKNSEIQELNDSIFRNKLTIEMLETSIEQQNQILYRLETKIKAIEQSFSWKITTPLRYFRGLFSR